MNLFYREEDEPLKSNDYFDRSNAHIHHKPNSKKIFHKINLKDLVKKNLPKDSEIDPLELGSKSSKDPQFEDYYPVQFEYNKGKVIGEIPLEMDYKFSVLSIVKEIEESNDSVCERKLENEKKPNKVINADTDYGLNQLSSVKESEIINLENESDPSKIVYCVKIKFEANFKLKESEIK